MENLFDLFARVGAERGVMFLVTIIFLVLATAGATIFYKNWKDEKAWQRKQAEEKRKDDKEQAKKQNALAEEQIKKQSEISEKMAYIISDNTLRINAFDKVLEKHTQSSSDSFKIIDNKLDTLEDKVQIIGECQDKLATREMIEDVSEDIKEIRSALKK